MALDLCIIVHHLDWLKYANTGRMGCGIVVIDINRCAILGQPDLVHQSNRLHRTGDGGLTNHRNASAAVNNRAKCHSSAVSKPREDTSKAQCKVRIRTSGHIRQTHMPVALRSRPLSCYHARADCTFIWASGTKSDSAVRCVGA